ncbi:hypothetical protein SKAU_G00021580 [Synaphobranchus kaupii]|uniref:C17orf113 probable zinc finger domain-containing protein n=1 Tax=Synaphobranchus kaupii TaxID=118154 RepID=A0A9Q1GBY9_SYNKA|nr:hypothetical protein SKAU_G00021580 [Synaphobranchus kaupii]
MYCKVCINKSKANSFTSGCDNFRTSTLERHVKSKDHRDALMESDGEKAMQSMLQRAMNEDEEATIKALQTVYFMAVGAEQLVGFGSDGAAEIISGLYYYFKHSTLRVAKLKEMEKVLHAPQLKMKEVHSVRWFSFYAALKALYRCWEPLAVMLEQQEEPKGKGILKNVASFKFLGAMSMLMDVIPVLTQLNLVFQKTDLDLVVVNPALEATKDQLRHLLTHDGTHALKFCGEAGETLKQYKGVAVTDSATQRRKVNTVKVDLVTNMLEQLEKRFPKEATDIVSAFSALAFPHIPEELESYGNEKVEFLIETYGSFVSAQETRAEWLCLKRLVVTEKYPCGKIGRLYNIIADHHPSSFPNILKLAGIAMALPVHTADVERGSNSSVLRTASKPLSVTAWVPKGSTPCSHSD